ncbi:MAG: hypothetical protein M3R67_00705 [Acidobacteriota bacterium]|nr:hypothetical protein [Acidobacteriota bacterium]
MQETTESGRKVVNELCDALRYLGDASYAILPKDVAHSLGDLKKSFLNTVRTLIDKDIEWVDARVAGGDRVREQWQEKWSRDKSAEAPDPIN